MTVCWGEGGQGKRRHLAHLSWEEGGEGQPGEPTSFVGTRTGSLVPSAGRPRTRAGDFR